MIVFTDVGFHPNSGFTKILCTPIFPLAYGFGAILKEYLVIFKVFFELNSFVPIIIIRETGKVTNRYGHIMTFSTA